MNNFLRTLFLNFLKSFSRKALPWHILAISLTILLVISGFDWWYFISTRNQVLSMVFFPAVILGGLVGMFFPIGLLIIAKRRQNEEMTLIAWLLGQAALLGWLISSIYKAFTGRIQPNLENITTDISRQFNFGFWEHGIFWGWPSSHTAVAFAMAVALFVFLFPKNRKIRYGVLLCALYIGLGVSLSIHWFSEFVAGAIIGSVIGIVVGKSFSKIA